MCPLHGALASLGCASLRLGQLGHRRPVPKKNSGAAKRMFSDIYETPSEQFPMDSDEERRLASLEEGNEDEERGDGSDAEQGENDEEQHAVVEPAFSKEGFLSKYRHCAIGAFWPTCRHRSLRHARISTYVFILSLHIEPASGKVTSTHSGSAGGSVFVTVHSNTTNQWATRRSVDKFRSSRCT